MFPAARPYVLPRHPVPPCRCPRRLSRVEARAVVQIRWLRMMGGGMMMRQPSSLDLSVADVKSNLGRWLLAGHPAPQSRQCRAERRDTITAGIVTTDNSLVQHLLSHDPTPNRTAGLTAASRRQAR